MAAGKQRVEDARGSRARAALEKLSQMGATRRHMRGRAQRQVGHACRRPPSIMGSRRSATSSSLAEIPPEFVAFEDGRSGELDPRSAQDVALFRIMDEPRQRLKSRMPNARAVVLGLGHRVRGSQRQGRSDRKADRIDAAAGLDVLDARFGNQILVRVALYRDDGCVRPRGVLSASPSRLSSPGCSRGARVAGAWGASCRGFICVRRWSCGAGPVAGRSAARC